MESQALIISTEIIVMVIANKMRILLHRLVSYNIYFCNFDEVIFIFADMHFLTVLIIHNLIILGTSSGNVSRFLEDGVGATFINNCHVNATRGEGSNKM